MIDQYSDDRTGWARFSDDMTMRYRLSRQVTANVTQWAKRVVFLMLNPSIADAFIVDPTIRECIKFTRFWGGDVLEVVNLFALRSPYPADLKKRAYGFRGDDSVNNQQIEEACAGAWKVIAAWGNDGILDRRDQFIRNLLKLNNIELHHLGTTNDGHPKHPLARGKHRIPADQQPIVWAL